MGTKNLISVIALFGFGAFFSFLTAWLILISPAIRLFTDRPGARKVHQKITPRIGGISIVISFLLFTFIWHFSPFMTLPHLSSQLLIAVIFATIGIAIIGICDDIILFKINGPIKFLIELLIAFIVIAISGIKLDTIHFVGQTYFLGFSAWPLTVLWLVGVTNAFNIVDGVDGLAGMVAMIAFVTIGILAYIGGDYSILILSILFAGLILGFLAHNMPPARIFLGDTGSLFLGMMVGLMCVNIVSNKNNEYSIIIAPLIVGFPLVDVGLALFRRFFKAIADRKSIFTSILKTMDADNEHIHHRLMFRGLNHSQTTTVITIYTVTNCAVAVVIAIDNTISALFFLAYLVLITGWFAYKLGFFDNIKKMFFKLKELNQKPQSNSTNQINIVVLNANEFLKHALESFKQDVFFLSFMESTEAIDETQKYSAILLNNSHIDNQIEELNHAINLSVRFQSPLVLIADEFDASSCERIKRSNINVLFVHKPIYVPKLFNDLYLFVVNSDSVSTLNCVFTTETRVSSLTERI